jgi:soluble lytic murein transglycosylase-like protein
LRWLAIATLGLVTSVGALANEAPASAFPYTVKTGDTLSAIAQRYCGDYIAMARENGIIDPNWIYADRTVLRLTDRCVRTASSAPSVTAKRAVSPREFAVGGEASSGKQSAKPEAKTQHQPRAIARTAPAPQPTRVIVAADPSLPLSVARHREIYRIVALRNINALHRTAAQRAELTRLTALIRQEVLMRYRLPNPDCLYAPNVGRDWREQTLTRVRCIRQNYGTVIDAVAASNRLPSAYLEAVIFVESGGQPDAISPTGCTGLKQFTQSSAKLFGLRDRFDPFESLHAGGRHLADNLRLWKGNVAQATAHYNIGSIVVGTKGFNAQAFPYTQSVLQVQRLIETDRRARGSSVSAARSL